MKLEIKRFAALFFAICVLFVGGIFTTTSGFLAYDENEEQNTENLESENELGDIENLDAEGEEDIEENLDMAPEDETPTIGEGEGSETVEEILEEEKQLLGAPPAGITITGGTEGQDYSFTTGSYTKITINSGATQDITISSNGAQVNNSVIYVESGFSHKLILKNLSMTQGTSADPIINSVRSSLNLEIVGTVSITNTATDQTIPAISLSGGANILGQGTLSVNSSTAGISIPSGSLNISEGATVNVETTGNAIDGGGDIDVSGGALSATSTDGAYAIKAKSVSQSGNSSVIVDAQATSGVGIYADALTYSEGIFKSKGNVSAVQITASGTANVPDTLMVAASYYASETATMNRPLSDSTITFDVVNGVKQFKYSTSVAKFVYITGSYTPPGPSKEDITPSVSIQGWTYGDAAKTPSITGNTGNGTVTYTYYTDSGYSTLTGTVNGATANGGVPQNAGTYYLKAEIAETDNYNAGTATTSFTIAKKDINPTVSIEDGGWTYDNAAKTPSITGNTGNGTVTYTYYTDSGYSTQTGTANGATVNGGVPQNAGTYYLKAEIAETDNYNAGTATTSFTIAKKDINPTVAIEDGGWTYDDAAKTPSITGNTGNGTVTYTYYTDSGYSTQTGTANGATVNGGVPQNAGTYYLKADIAQTTNYNSGTASTSFTINKKAITSDMNIPSAKTVSCMTNQSDQGGEITLSELGISDTALPGANIKSVGSPSKSGVVSLSGTNYTFANSATQDTATVEVIISSTNYADHTYTITFEIKDKTPVTITLPTKQDGTYSGSEITGYTGSVSATIPESGAYSGSWNAPAYSGRNSTSYNSTTPPTNAGDYRVTFSVDSEDYSGSAYIDFTISKLELTVNPTAASKEYGQDDPQLQYTTSPSLIGTDSISGNLKRASGEDLGEYGFDISELNPGNNYSLTLNETPKFTITQCDISEGTVNLASGTLTYNASEQTKVVTSVVVNGKTLTASDYEVSGNKGTNAGTYPITITGTGNYTGTIQGTATTAPNFTINKKKVTVDTAPTAKVNLSFNNSTQSLLEGLGAASDGAAMKYNVDDAGWTDVAEGTDAKTYTVKYKAVPTDLTNYEESEEGSITASIKGTPASVSAPTPNNRTYDGSNADLVTPVGTATGGVLNYKLGASGTYSSTIPKATDAGEYTVYYKVIANIAGYEDSEENSVTVTISRANLNPAPTVTISSWNFGQSPASPSVTGNTGNGTVTYEYKVRGAADSTYTGAVPTAAGNYTVRANIAQSTNYNAAICEADFEIIAASAGLTVTPTAVGTLSYNGVPRPIVNPGAAVGGTLEYSKDGINYSSVIPTETNAGTYNVFYRVKGDGNHTDLAPVEISSSAVITALDLNSASIKLGKALVENGETQSQEFDLTVGGVTVPKADYNVSGNSNSAAGKYTLSISPKTGNITGGPVTADYVIAPSGFSDENKFDDASVSFGAGTVSVDVDINSDKMPSLSVNASAEDIFIGLINSGLIDIDDLLDVFGGENLSIRFAMERSDDTVSAASKNAIRGMLGKDYTVAMYFDISIYMQIGTEPEQVMPELGDAVEISFEIPKDYLNTNPRVSRSHRVVRYHDGAAEFVDKSYNTEKNVLTFASNKFSDYAYAYNDAERTVAEATKDNMTKLVKSPKTAFTEIAKDPLSGWPLYALAALLIVVSALLIRKKHA